MTKHKAGTVFEREYKGKKVKFAVKKDGQYHFNGKPYRSLSAAVAKITGTKTPATVFFKVSKGAKKKRASRYVTEVPSKRRGKAAEANGTFSVGEVIQEAVNKAVANINIEGLVEQSVRRLFHNDGN